MLVFSVGLVFDMQVCLLSVVFTNSSGTHRKARCCLSAWLPLWNYHWHKAPIALCPGAGTTEAGGERKGTVSGGRASRFPWRKVWLQPAGMWPYKQELRNCQLGLLASLNSELQWNARAPGRSFEELRRHWITWLNRASLYRRHVGKRLLNLSRLGETCLRKVCLEETGKECVWFEIFDFSCWF